MHLSCLRHMGKVGTPARGSSLRSLQTYCGLLPARPPCLQEPFWLLLLSVEAISFVAALDVNVSCCFSVAMQKKKN